MTMCSAAGRPTVPPDPKHDRDDRDGDHGDEPVWSDWTDVPAVGAEAVPDPHWADTQGGSPLPGIYMPPSMPGRRPGWVRLAVWVLVTVFITATMLGVCLTYGPSL